MTSQIRRFRQAELVSKDCRVFETCKGSKFELTSKVAGIVGSKLESFERIQGVESEHLCVCFFLFVLKYRRN